METKTLLGKVLSELKALNYRLESVESGIESVKVNSTLSAKNVLTAKDVCLLADLSKSYLYKLTCTHQIPYYKGNGSKIYFDRKEVENWMKQNRYQTTTEAEQKAVNYVVSKKRKEGNYEI